MPLATTSRRGQVKVEKLLQTGHGMLQATKVLQTLAGYTEGTKCHKPPRVFR
ncbi:hypothetical protein DPMN_046268 [Dreissena polymorpha]|uniref:Uncharacterized protein n=1 Tax=Dreissena polymorpha TaxID=45954 RepID=A0A9D4I0E2_DREPO|nr:hypothetical protein DPMN_046268 [Dreissena polymorpha]